MLQWLEDSWVVRSGSPTMLPPLTGARRPQQGVQGRVTCRRQARGSRRALAAPQARRAPRLQARQSWVLGTQGVCVPVRREIMRWTCRAGLSATGKAQPETGLGRGRSAAFSGNPSEMISCRVSTGRVLQAPQAGAKAQGQESTSQKASGRSGGSQGARRRRRGRGGGRHQALQDSHGKDLGGHAQ